MTYKLVCDSSCDLTKEMEALYNIDIAPLKFTLDGEEFIDDESMDLEAYLAKIAASSNVPKSACPSIGDYLDAFEGDHEWVFGVTISSALSGSYNSALNAKALYLEKHPQKKVHIFDSYGASSMEVLIVLKVVELVEENLSFEDIVKKVEAYIEEAKVMFVLDKIDTLEKNGRMSSMKAKIVRVLNLKLILKATQEGSIDLMGQARGTKKALKKMVQDMVKLGSVSKDKICAISHCNAPERAEYVKSLVEELYTFRQVIILKMRGLSSTYANEGGIIISF